MDRFWQDTLRAVNLLAALEQGLAIDINLAFVEGAVGPAEERLRSRRMLATVQVCAGERARGRACGEREGVCVGEIGRMCV